MQLAAPDPEGQDFWRYLGIRMTRQQPGEADVELDVALQHLQGQGVVHGGVIASMADAAMAVAFAQLAPDEDMSTIELSVRFMRPVRAGRLTARGRVIQTTRSLYFAEATVRCGQDAVAVAQATFKRMPQR